jgi:hypothetical protein
MTCRETVLTATTFGARGVADAEVSCAGRGVRIVVPLGDVYSHGAGEPVEVYDAESVGVPDCCRRAVRHEALFVTNGGGRPSSLRRRSGGVKLEAAVLGDHREPVGAASTKSGRFRTAGWVGPGERDGKVYERNRCRYASSGNASSNPVDVGWYAVHVRPSFRAGDSWSGLLFAAGRPR